MGEPKTRSIATVLAIGSVHQREGSTMRRREFIVGLGGAVVWPVAARAQQPDRVRRVGVLMGLDETDAEGKTQLSGFTQGLAELGWSDGRNLRTDVRWGAANVDRMRMFAKELVELQPDVILAHATAATAPLQRETRSIPIVFVIVADPVGAGFVAGLPRPGGNITGFISYEASVAGKWLELLAEIAPGAKRVAAMFNPGTAPFVRSYYLPVFEAAARSLKVEPITAPVHSDAEIETVMTSLGREPGGGLVVMPESFMVDHRAPIIMLAGQSNVPAVYPISVFARDGGLLSYGPNNRDIFHRAASYVDRILRGAKPAELPVQVPIKFEMALNAKTAKALSLTVPQSILLRADEVIE
jgi:putative tryptophan/tyrosine transport system substrate-binding protein